MAALAVRRPAHDDAEGDELGDGEHGGGADLAELRRPPPDLDLERRPCRRSPRMRITPNDVNVNRNTIAPAASDAPAAAAEV